MSETSEEKLLKANPNPNPKRRQRKRKCLRIFFRVERPCYDLLARVETAREASRKDHKLKEWHIWRGEGEPIQYMALSLSLLIGSITILATTLFQGRAMAPSMLCKPFLPIVRQLSYYGAVQYGAVSDRLVSPPPVQSLGLPEPADRA